MNSIHLVSWFLVLQYPGYLETSYLDDKYFSSSNKQDNYVTKTCNDYRRRLNNQRTVTILQKLSVLPPEWKLTKLDPDPLGEIYNYAFQALLINLFCPNPPAFRTNPQDDEKNNLQGQPLPNEPVPLSKLCSQYANCKDIVWDY